MSPKTQRVWITLATVAGMTVTALLGRWQLHRAAEKEGRAAEIAARATLPVIDARSVTGPGVDPSLLYRRVEARGHWLAKYTVALDNRPMDNQPGFYIVTPLQLDGAEGVILVQRGWVPRNFEDRTRLPPYATPEDSVVVQGRLAPSLARLYELGSGQGGLIRQNLDVAQFRLETGLPLADATVEQEGEASEGLRRDWPAIDLGVERHYGYAFQWFGLCALMAVLYVWYQFIRRPRQPTA